jgi:GntR family transcriptional regulator
MVNPSSDRAVYQQIADMLRSRIRSGTYGPGSKLPSETELVAEFQASRLTVRRGLAVLQQQGLTEARRGQGVFVRQSPPVMTLRSSRFNRSARRAGKGALAAEAEALGLEWRTEDLGPIEPIELPADVAEVLGESRGYVKRRRMWVDGVPTQLADSYVPASIAEEIAWSDNATTTLYVLLERHGHDIVRFREEITVRHASPEEAVALDLPDATPVAGLVRHAIDASGRTCEFFDSVAVADRHRFVYEFSVFDD